MVHLKTTVFSKRRPMGPLDAAAQSTSFYIERIELASKLRELNKKWRWSRPFSGKSCLIYFQTLVHQISLLASADTLSSFFSLQTSKTNHPLPFKLTPTKFQFSPLSCETCLKSLTKAKF